MNAPSTSSTLRQELQAGLLAAGLAVILLLIPVVHFVGGPLGPFLGAVVMSLRTPLRGRGILVVGATAGAAEGLVVAVVMRVTMALSEVGRETPDWLRTVMEPSTVMIIVAGVWAYATALAIMGAALGTAFRQRAS